MARTVLTVQQVSRAGITPSFSAANADGHSISGDPNRLYLEVKNAGGSPITVTLQIPRTIDGQSVANSGRQVTVAATTGDKIIGPFTSEYQQANGMIYVDFSGVTSVTVAAFSL